MNAELTDIYQRNYFRMKATGQIRTGKGKNDGPEPTAADRKVLDKLNEMMNTPGFLADDVATVGRLVKQLGGALDKEDREETVNHLRKVYRRNVAAIKRAQKGGRGKPSAASDPILKAPPMRGRARSRSRGGIAVI